jgi:radical SAM protein with 4Fe4S-binding SPASM domain
VGSEERILDDRCWKMWHSCVITWDGRVVPCCFDKDAHYVLGDLRKQSFREIWNGDAYDEFQADLVPLTQQYRDVQELL